MFTERFKALLQIVLGLGSIFAIFALRLDVEGEVLEVMLYLPVILAMRGFDQLLRFEHISFPDPSDPPKAHHEAIQYLASDSLLERGSGLPGQGSLTEWGTLEVASSSTYEGRSYGYVLFNIKRKLDTRQGIYIRWEPYRQHYFSGYVSSKDNFVFGMIGMISTVIYYPLVSLIFGIGGRNELSTFWFGLNLGTALLLGILTQVVFEMFEKEWHLKERISKLWGRSDARLRAVQLHADLAKILGVREVYGVFVEGRLVTFYPLERAGDASVQAAEFARIERLVDVQNDHGMMKFQPKAK
ncbi:MAG: hypothetical protein KF767_07840 [Bdellovibrionaceae bacterium]|nr:hypothetical protein [Pseudobdellovibrionaceae bacterium]